MKRGNLIEKKRGQTYFIIVFALVFLIIAFSIFQIFFVEDKTEKTYYDLRNEMDWETSQVYDYGIYHGEETQELIEKWIEEYLLYLEGKHTEEKWAFIYGDETNITIITFSIEKTGEISLKDSRYPLYGSEKQIKHKTPSDGLVNIKLEDKDGEEIELDFELKEGESFFTVVEVKEKSKN